MSFLLRPSTVFARVSRQTRIPASMSFVHPLSYSQRYRAQGYGDGEGDPKAPPSEGQGTGGATKAGGQKTPEDASAESGGSRSKEAKEKGSSPTGGALGKGTRSYHTSTRRLQATQKGPEKEAQKAGGPDGAKPKILDSKKPGGDIEDISKEKKVEVDKHNKDFEKGHDRAAEQDSEKVDPKFWKGIGR